MTRVKRGVQASKRRKNLLKNTRGFQGVRNNKYRLAKEALMHAYKYAFRDRKKKKGAKRALWNVQINAALRPYGTSYSVFMGNLKKKNVALDRKILSDLAQHNAEIFKAVVKEAK